MKIPFIRRHMTAYYRKATKTMIQFKFKNNNFT